MDPRRFKQLVDQVAEIALGNDKWRGGDIALEIAPDDVDLVREGPGTLRDMAEQAGVPFEKLTAWRDVAKKWPPATRQHDIAWSVHYEVRNRPDRHEFLASLPRDGNRWSVSRVREKLGKARSFYAKPDGSTMTAADRARMVADALRDDDVRAAIQANVDHRDAVTEAEAEMWVQTRERETRERRARGDGQPEAFVAAVGNIARARTLIQLALEELKDEHALPASAREAMTEQAHRLAVEIGWLVSFLDNGDLSWEDALAALTEEGT